MGKIIAIASQKGGVGKTTACLNLGAGLAKIGKKVLLVDTDPQGALAIASNLTRITRKGLTQLLRSELRESDIIVQAGKRSLFLVGTGVETLDDLLFFREECDNGHLGMVLKGLAIGFDFILLDTRTGMDSSLLHLLAAADSVLLPCTCQATTIKTLPLFLKGIQKVREGHPQLALEGVLLTMTSDNDPWNPRIREEIIRAFPAEIFFDTSIPFLSSFELAALHAVPVTLLKKAPAAIQAFDTLAVELAARQTSPRS